MMADIFSGADHVRVFFNPDNSLSQWVGRAINVLLETKDYPLLTDALVDGEPFNLTHLGWAVALGFDSWWSRGWVVQEYALAKTLVFHYQDKDFDWDSLDNFVWKLNAYRNLCLKQGARIERLEERSMLDLVGQISTMKRVRQAFMSVSYPNGQIQVIQLLCQIFFEMRKRQVTDPKDRVYGLLALLSRTFGRTLIEPNYRASLRDIYIDFTFRFMQRSGSLSLLSQTSPCTNNITSLPSWVPDFSSRYDFFTESRRTPPGTFNASHSRQLEVDRSPLGDWLRLRGLFVDKVAHVGAINDSRSDSLGRWHARSLGLWGAQCLSIFPDARKAPYVGNCKCTVWSGFYISMFNTRVCDDSVEPEIFGFEKMLSRLDAHTPPFNTLASLALANPDSKMDWVRGHIAKRRFFTTYKGYIGLGSCDMQVGDSVFILSGGELPYILRKCKRGDGKITATGTTAKEDEDGSMEQYLFIGDSYVHGIMDGEFAQDCPDSDFVPLWLV